MKAIVNFFGPLFNLLLGINSTSRTPTPAAERRTEMEADETTDFADGSKPSFVPELQVEMADAGYLPLAAELPTMVCASRQTRSPRRRSRGMHISAMPRKWTPAGLRSATFVSRNGNLLSARVVERDGNNILTLRRGRQTFFRKLVSAV